MKQFQVKKKLIIVFFFTILFLIDFYLKYEQFKREKEYLINTAINNQLLLAVIL